MKLRAPFNYFGCKIKVSDIVWEALGSDIPIYYEPFFGSGAVLLNRPIYDPTKNMEVVNDKDAFLCNFWRAVQKDPDGVAKVFDRPVNHAELIAIRRHLKSKEGDLFTKVTNDLFYYDVETAGLWLYNTNLSFRVGRFDNTIPLLKYGGEGLFKSKYVSDELENSKVKEYLREVCIRLKNVKVTCGDWTTLCKDRWWTTSGGTKTAGFFLDPPYSFSRRKSCDSVYLCDDENVYKDVVNWCVENGEKKYFRIVFACYLDEGSILENYGWRSLAWKSSGSRLVDKSDDNLNRERLWFSPQCLNIDIDKYDGRSTKLFNGGAVEGCYGNS